MINQAMISAIAQSMAGEKLIDCQVVYFATAKDLESIVRDSWERLATLHKLPGATFEMRGWGADEQGIPMWRIWGIHNQMEEHEPCVWSINVKLHNPELLEAGSGQ